MPFIIEWTKKSVKKEETQQKSQTQTLVTVSFHFHFHCALIRNYPAKSDEGKAERNKLRWCRSSETKKEVIQQLRDVNMIFNVNTNNS